MKRDRNPLKAGIFIIISVIAIVTVIIVIRGEGAGATKVRTVVFTLQDDLGGLSVGDEVRIGGVKIGTVRDIHFESLESADPKVIVKFSMPAEYPIRDDAHIGVQASLTGSPNLNIASLGSGNALADNATLAGTADPKSAFLAVLGKAAPGIQKLLDTFENKTIPKVNDAIDAFHKTADSATALVHHGDEKIGPVADHASEALVQVRDLVGDTKTDLRTTAKNLSVATDSVREKLPALIDKVTGVIDKVDGGVTSARAALEDVQKTAANARDLTGSARSIIVDNRGKLDAMVKSLKSTSDNLKATSIEVRHSPWRLLYKPSPDEMANLNLYDSARQFADGAGNLSDAATALRDSLADPNADKAQIQKLIEHLDESFKNFHQMEGKLITAVKE